jgi:hypothetical protein
MPAAVQLWRAANATASSKNCLHDDTTYFVQNYFRRQILGGTTQRPRPSVDAFCESKVGYLQTKTFCSSKSLNQFHAKRQILIMAIYLQHPDYSSQQQQQQQRASVVYKEALCYLIIA